MCENDNDTHSELENEDFGFMDGTSDDEMERRQPGIRASGGSDVATSLVDIVRLGRETSVFWWPCSCFPFMPVEAVITQLFDPRRSDETSKHNEILDRISQSTGGIFRASRLF